MTTETAVAVASNPVSMKAWWTRPRIWVPLVFVFANLAAAFALEWLGLQVRRFGGFRWSDLTFAVPLGVGAGQLFLAALWLSFGRGWPLIMWPAIFLLIGLGCLARLFGAYVPGIAWEYLGPLVAVNWPGSYIIATQFFVVWPMVLLPLRYLLGWELDFESPPNASRRLRSLQFSLVQIFGLMLAAAVSLALIRMVYLLHAETDRHDLFSGGLLILFSLAWFSPTVVPLAATGWLMLGAKRQWIGALVLGLALACPSLIVEWGLARYVEMPARSLWVIHWVNISAVVWVATNLGVLRWMGLKLFPAARPLERQRPLTEASTA